MKLLIGIIMILAGSVCDAIAMYRQFGLIGLFIDSDGILGLWALLHQKIACVGLILFIIGLILVMKASEEMFS